MSHREVFKYSPKYSYTISNSRVCYLDTCIIRRRISTLNSSPLSNISYTSVISIMELLIRARKSNKDFRIIQKALKTIFDSNIVVDWRFPEAVILSAFSITRPKADIYEERTVSIKRIVRLILDSKSLYEFRYRLLKISLTHDIDYFENYIMNHRKYFFIASIDARKKSLETFNPKSDVVKMLELPENILHDEYVSSFRDSSLNYLLSLKVILDDIYNESKIYGINSEEELLSSYDRSIDIYLKAMGWWQLEQNLGRMPNKNDAVDLLHLLYIVPDAHLVTTDNRFAKCAESIGVSVIDQEGIVAN